MIVAQGEAQAAVERALVDDALDDVGGDVERCGGERSANPGAIAALAGVSAFVELAAAWAVVRASRRL